MTPSRKERVHTNQVPRFSIGQPFNPYKLFTGIFIPEALVRYRGLTCGAKIAYGRLARFAGANGDCWPSVPTLASEMGIGATQARTYVHELRDERFIAIEQRPGTSGVYKFLWHEAFDGEIGDKRKAPPLRKTGGVPPRRTGDAPLRKTGPPPLRKTGDEESQVKESHHQESQVKENQACAPVRAVSGKTDTHNPSVSLSVDDDEKSHEAPVSPWEELRAEYRKANRGTEMGFQDECWLKEQMELRGVTPEGLVKLVHENPLNGFHSAMAGLKWLVKKFRTKTRSAMELAAEAASTFRPPVETPRCEKCGSSGRIIERIEGQRPTVTDQYCDCRMGKAVAAIERRKHTAPVPADGNTIQRRPPGSSGAGAETGDHCVAGILAGHNSSQTVPVNFLAMKAVGGLE